MTEARDMGPDVELLADLVEAVEEGRVPTQAALEEAVLLAEGLAPVATRLRRRRALRKWDELWATGDYSSRCAVDARVAAHVHSTPATVRWWRCWLGHVVPQRGA